MRLCISRQQDRKAISEKDIQIQHQRSVREVRMFNRGREAKKSHKMRIICLEEGTLKRK